MYFKRHFYHYSHHLTGAGIVVPPPSVSDPTSHNALTEGQEDDGQYREDPKIYEDPKYNGRAQSRPSAIRQFLKPTQPEPQYQEYQPQQNYQQPQQNYQQPEYQQARQQPSSFRSNPVYSQQTNLFSQSPQQFPQERPQSQIYHQQPQFSYQSFTPQYNQYQQYQPQSYQQNYNPFSGHPAQNFDPNTGSYTIDFTG